ncbi:MAG: hypothetical protein IKL48_06180 [Elusimicrobiaceae bacterium]|nr:hypothetical protein [Elusimicrobiaceae bacterium]
MSKVDSRLKTIFSVAFAWVIIILLVVGYLHLSAQHRQAQRELIYIKALNQVAQERRARQQEYDKRRKEAQLRREYNQGQVVGTVSLSN